MSAPASHQVEAVDAVAVFQSLWEVEQRYLKQFRRGDKEARYLREHLEDASEVRRHLRSVDRMVPYVGS